MLDAPLPVAFVTAAIVPIHFAISVPYIVKVIAFVNIAACPSKNTITTFLIVGILALVLIRLTRTTLPDSIAVPQSVLKVSFKKAAICPVVFAVTGRLSIDITTDINIPISELFRPLSMFQTTLELAFVTVSINPGMHTIPVGFAELPLTNV
jgi:hypothetical protein